MFVVTNYSNIRRTGGFTVVYMDKSGLYCKYRREGIKHAPRIADQVVSTDYYDPRGVRGVEPVITSTRRYDICEITYLGGYIMQLETLEKSRKEEINKYEFCRIRKTKETKNLGGTGMTKKDAENLRTWNKRHTIKQTPILHIYEPAERAAALRVRDNEAKALRLKELNKKLEESKVYLDDTNDHLELLKTRKEIFPSQKSEIDALIEEVKANAKPLKVPKTAQMVTKMTNNYPSNYKGKPRGMISKRFFENEPYLGDPMGEGLTGKRPSPTYEDTPLKTKGTVYYDWVGPLSFKPETRGTGDGFHYKGAAEVPSTGLSTRKIVAKYMPSKSIPEIEEISAVEAMNLAIYKDELDSFHPRMRRITSLSDENDFIKPLKAWNTSKSKIDYYHDKPITELTDNQLKAVKVPKSSGKNAEAEAGVAQALDSMGMHDKEPIRHGDSPDIAAPIKRNPMMGPAQIITVTNLMKSIIPNITEDKKGFGLIKGYKAKYYPENKVDYVQSVSKWKINTKFLKIPKKLPIEAVVKVNGYNYVDLKILGVTKTSELVSATESRHSYSDFHLLLALYKMYLLTKDLRTLSKKQKELLPIGKINKAMKVAFEAKIDEKAHAVLPPVKIDKKRKALYIEAQKDKKVQVKIPRVKSGSVGTLSMKKLDKAIEYGLKEGYRNTELLKILKHPKCKLNTKKPVMFAAMFHKVNSGLKRQSEGLYIVDEDFRYRVPFVNSSFFEYDGEPLKIIKASYITKESLKTIKAKNRTWKAFRSPVAGAIKTEKAYVGFGRNIFRDPERKPICLHAPDILPVPNKIFRTEEIWNQRKHSGKRLNWTTKTFETWWDRKVAYTPFVKQYNTHTRIVNERLVTKESMNQRRINRLLLHCDAILSYLDRTQRSSGFLDKSDKTWYQCEINLGRLLPVLHPDLYPAYAFSVQVNGLMTVNIYTLQ